VVNPRVVLFGNFSRCLSPCWWPEQRGTIYDSDEDGFNHEP